LLITRKQDDKIKQVAVNEKKMEESVKAIYENVEKVPTFCIIMPFF